MLLNQVSFREYYNITITTTIMMMTIMIITTERIIIIEIPSLLSSFE